MLNRTMFAKPLNLALAAVVALPLGACVSVPDQMASAQAAAEGSLVALNKSVKVGAVVATPQKVVEDSRCPINARCIHAGRLLVSTQLETPDWNGTVVLELGKPVVVEGATIALVSGDPLPVAGEPRDPAAYRFAFEAR